MNRLYVYLGVFALSGSLLVWYFLQLKTGTYSNELWSIISIPFTTSIGLIIGFLVENWDSLLLYLKCVLLKRNNEVYVSLSYLFKIKVKGTNRYLLVKSNKIKNQYQPVGGVYKRYPSLNQKWNEWGALEAMNDPTNSNDLRFKVKRKYIPTVRRWFLQNKNREINVCREFREELVETGILDFDLFKHINAEFLKRKEEHLICRKGKDIRQFLIYDIYSVVLNEQQEKMILGLYEQSPMTTQYAFVKEEELDKELFYFDDEEYQLGYHARYIK